MTIEIRPTHCNCHPETCCCSPFQVFRNGKRVGNSVTKELADLIEAQAREIERLRNPWQPIETAPKDGSRVMLWRGPSSFGVWAEMIVAEWHDNEWQWPDADGVRGTPSTHGEWTREQLYFGFSSASDFTHWMPLPEPPQ